MQFFEKYLNIDISRKIGYNPQINDAGKRRFHKNLQMILSIYPNKGTLERDYGSWPNFLLSAENTTTFPEITKSQRSASNNHAITYNKTRNSEEFKNNRLTSDYQNKGLTLPRKKHYFNKKSMLPKRNISSYLLEENKELIVNKLKPQGKINHINSFCHHTKQRTQEEFPSVTPKKNSNPDLPSLVRKEKKKICCFIPVIKKNPLDLFESKKSYDEKNVEFSFNEE